MSGKKLTGWVEGVQPTTAQEGALYGMYIYMRCAAADAADAMRLEDVG